MKQLNCVIAISITSCLFFNPVVFAAGISGLEEIYNTPIPCEIRRNFNAYIHMREIYPEAELSVLDGEKFKDIYNKKFLVIGVQPNSFGGLWVTILVKAEKLRFFRLWLYNIDYDEYDLRSITELFGYFGEEGI